MTGEGRLVLPTAPTRAGTARQRGRWGGISSPGVPPIAPLVAAPGTCRRDASWQPCRAGQAGGTLRPRSVSMAPASAAGTCSYIFKKGLGWGGRSVSIQPFSQQTWIELALASEQASGGVGAVAVPPLPARERPWGVRAAGGARGSLCPPWPLSLQGEEEEEAELGT